MIEDTVKTIKDIEVKADGIIRDAEAECASIIAEAQKQAESIKNAAISEADAYVKRAVAAEKAAGEEMLKTTASATENETAVLRENSRALEQNAISEIIAEIVQ